MNAIRTFIAIEMPGEVIKSLGEIINSMRSEKTRFVRWVAPDNIHLTLKFLGDVSPTNLDLVKRALQNIVTQYPPFVVKLGGLGAFPNIKRPRVIWIGVEAPPTLLALNQSIEAETRRLGYTAEDRSFSPHLTLGRINHNVDSSDISGISDIISKTRVGVIGSFPVEGVTLFKSDLHPGGSIYTPMLRASLHTEPGYISGR